MNENKLDLLKWSDGSEQDKDVVKESNKKFFEHRQQVWAASTQSVEDNQIATVS